MTLNVSVIKLSPYSPELNPIEQVWRWLRQPIFYVLRRHLLQSLRCIVSVFGLPQKSHQNMLEKMDRPDQLIFQIGMTSLGRENDSP
ncbi:transposase [Vibrio parahaemolyticus]|nr:transposase [Vibrio parahaemolyticus]EKZ9250558.1 transposase [Vibrio parahaemolyticus]ELA6679634.1 transposase [Vibrio parahaemolyticus]